MREKAAPRAWGFFGFQLRHEDQVRGLTSMDEHPEDQSKARWKPATLMRVGLAKAVPCSQRWPT